jgi:hypothetical protein
MGATAERAEPRGTLLVIARYPLMQGPPRDPEAQACQTGVARLEKHPHPVQSLPL